MKTLHARFVPPNLVPSTASTEQDLLLLLLLFDLKLNKFYYPKKRMGEGNEKNKVGIKLAGPDQPFFDNPELIFIAKQHPI